MNNQSLSLLSIPKHIPCKHERWIAKIIPRSDDQLTLREFCDLCGISSSGSNLGFALPMIPDSEVTVPSFKYPGKNLGEIAKTDRPYLQWIVLESKASDRIKKSAARLFFNCGYVPPNDGDIYDASKRYNPTEAWELINRIKNIPLDTQNS